MRRALKLPPSASPLLRHRLEIAAAAAAVLIAALTAAASLASLEWALDRWRETSHRLLPAPFARPHHPPPWRVRNAPAPSKPTAARPLT